MPISRILPILLLPLCIGQAHADNMFDTFNMGELFGNNRQQAYGNGSGDTQGRTRGRGEADINMDFNLDFRAQGWGLGQTDANTANRGFFQQFMAPQWDAYGNGHSNGNNNAGSYRYAQPYASPYYYPPQAPSYGYTYPYYYPAYPAYYSYYYSPAQ